MGRISRHTALAVHPQHLGRGLARQHRTFHPGHRPGVLDSHGGASQRRDPCPVVLPVGVPRAGRGVLPVNRRGTHHRLHTEFAGRLGLAVSGQCSRSHLARGALTPGRAVVGLLRLGRVARRRSGGHRRGTLGVVHRGALRRVRYRRYAQPGGLRHRGADDGADHLDIAAPRPHPGGRASAGRRLLTAHYRRYRRSAVGVGLVAFSRHCGILCDQGWPTC